MCEPMALVGLLSAGAQVYTANQATGQARQAAAEREKIAKEQRNLAVAERSEADQERRQARRETWGNRRKAGLGGVNLGAVFGTGGRSFFAAS